MTGQETISPTTWFVTGCSRGLGLAFVRALSKEACNIVIATCRSPSSARALNAIAKECNAHPGDLGELYIVRLDVEDETSIKEAADEAERILEPKGLGLDYLLNNAGIVSSSFRDFVCLYVSSPKLCRHPYMKLFEDHMIPFNIDNFMATMRANVVGPALITAALLPLLRKGRRGVVMNMSSTMGSIGSDMGLKMGTYSMSKAALNMMVRLKT